MVVFPHPDDESVMVSGLVQRAQRLGWKVGILCLTHGERGKVHLRVRKQSLFTIREREFATAMRILQPDLIQMWSYPDGMLRQNGEWRKRLASEIQNIKPGIVITYDHTGVTGHPDHIALSSEVFDILKRSHHTQLLWPSFCGRARNWWLDRRFFDRVEEPEWRLQLTLTELLKKRAAIRAHRSQALGRSYRLGLFLELSLHPFEDFVQADLKSTYDSQYIQYTI